MKYCHLITLFMGIFFTFSFQAMEKSTELPTPLQSPGLVIEELSKNRKDRAQALVYALLNCQSLLDVQELVMQNAKENVAILNKIHVYEEKIRQSPYYSINKQTGQYTLILDTPTFNDPDKLALGLKIMSLLRPYGLRTINVPERKLKKLSSLLGDMRKFGFHQYAEVLFLDIEKATLVHKQTDNIDLIADLLNQYWFSNIPKNACTPYYICLQDIGKAMKAFKEILEETGGEPSDEEYDRFMDQWKRVVAIYFQGGLRESCYNLYKAVNHKINVLALALKKSGIKINRISALTQEKLPSELYSQRGESQQEQKTTRKAKPKSKAKQKGKSKAKQKSSPKSKQKKKASTRTITKGKEKEEIPATSTLLSKQASITPKGGGLQEASLNVAPPNTKIFPDGSFIDARRSTDYITYVNDPKNKVVIGIYNSQKSGENIPLIKKYSKTVQAWRKDPDEQMKLQGYFDPQSPKYKYQQNAILIHNFALAIDSLIPTLASLAVAPRSAFYNPVTDMCITMAGFVQYPNIKDVKYCLFVYLVNKSDHICFHRNIEFRDGKNLYEGYRDKGYFDVEFPELSATMH